MGCSASVYCLSDGYFRQITFKPTIKSPIVIKGEMSDINEQMNVIFIVFSIAYVVYLARK